MKPYRRFAACVLALLLAGAVPANATLSAAPYPPLDAPPAAISLIDYLHTELRSKDALRRQNALVDVVALASCSGSCTIPFRSLPNQTLRIENEMGVGTALDLTALLPDLQRIYYTDRSDGLRIQALAALLRIGNEPALEAIISVPARSSARVRDITQRSVASFFLTKYPDLNKSAVRRGTFSLDDVRVARLRQERMLRRAARRG